MSKENPQVQVASSNCMSALARSSFDLSFKDLKGLVIPEADLSGSNLQSSNLRKSDLQGVKFYQANLTNIDFSLCNLLEAQFHNQIHLHHPQWCLALCFSNCGKYLYSTFGQTLRKWNLKEKTIEKDIINQNSRVQCFKINCNIDYIYKWMDIPFEEQVFEQDQYIMNPIFYVCNNHQQYVAIGRMNGLIEIWDIQEQKIIMDTKMNSSIVFLKFSNNGKFILGHSIMGQVEIRRLDNQEVIFLRRVLQYTFSGYFFLHRVDLSQDDKGLFVCQENTISL